MVQFTALALTFGALISSVTAHPSHPVIKPRFVPTCRAERTPEFIAASKAMAVAEADQARAGVGKSEPITVETHIHVVAKSRLASRGYIPESQLEEQMKTLNTDFGKFHYAAFLTTFYANVAMMISSIRHPIQMGHHGLYN